MHASKLTKPVRRQTNKIIGKRRVIITIAPGTEKRGDLIGLRLKGQRSGFVVCLSDIYRLAALWHGNKERLAKQAARKAGIPWKRAKKTFNSQNTI